MNKKSKPCFSSQERINSSNPHKQCKWDISGNKGILLDIEKKVQEINRKLDEELDRLIARDS